jgi:hypothetical protein
MKSSEQIWVARVNLKRHVEPSTRPGVSCCIKGESVLVVWPGRNRYGWYCRMS